nr:MAG TPA: hypothetical protein [Caudoviricetes sp.]
MKKPILEREIISIEHLIDVLLENELPSLYRDRYVDDRHTHIHWELVRDRNCDDTKKILFHGVSGSDKFDIYLEGVVYDIINHLSDDNHIYITDDDYQKYVVGNKFRSDVERIMKNHMLSVLQDMITYALQPKAY